MKETGTTHWNSPNTGATNESGFSGLPGGYRGDVGSFLDIGGYALFWSSTGYGGSNAWQRYLRCDYSKVFREYDPNQLGFSVRCIKD